MADEQVSNEPPSTAESRRSVIKKAGIAAAAVWVAPTVLRTTVAAAASGDSRNLAPEGTALQSSTGFGGVASRGNDNVTSCDWSSSSVFHTNSELDAWWEVDLGSPHALSSIVLFNRCDCCSNLAQNVAVFVDGVFQGIVPDTIDGSAGWSTWTGGTYSASMALSVTGRYVRVVNGNGTTFFHLAEVQVFGT